MPRQLPPLAALLTLESIIRTGSAANAAQDLSLSASAVSQRIRQLEDWFKCTLFQREGGKLLPTPQAHDLYRTCIESFDALEHQSQILRQQSDDSSIRISAIPSFAYLVLMPILNQFKKQFPQYDVSLQTSNQIVDMREQNLDIAIRYTHNIQVEGLSFEKLASESVFPVAAPALLEQHHTQDMTELARKVGLIIDVSRKLGDANPKWTDWLNASDYGSLSEYRTTAFSEYQFAVKSAVEGQGLLLGREVLIQNELKTGALVRLNSHEIQSKVGYYLVTRKDRPMRNSVKDFVRFLQQPLG